MIYAKRDSAATAHYFKCEDKIALQNIKNTIGPTVTLPNNTTITSTISGTAPLSTSLNDKGKQVHVFKNLKNASLISLGQLCDNDCEITLYKKRFIS